MAAKTNKQRMSWFSLIACGFAALAFTRPATAVDEIQVYNAGIAAPGQLTIQQHLNYVALGLKQPPFPGGLVSNGSINGTPEFAYGLTDWWEVGLYLPFAIQETASSYRIQSNCEPCSFPRMQISEISFMV
ncbi:hypothetical protein [Bradyrhizobium sp. LB12.1]|uniref:hypothetical protein n=1 Tax=unclassified Bradyrhizobium TaxID=2631580 RepID=UPI00339A4572